MYKSLEVKGKCNDKWVYGGFLRPNYIISRDESKPLTKDNLEIYEVDTDTLCISTPYKVVLDLSHIDEEHRHNYKNYIKRKQLRDYQDITGSTILKEDSLEDIKDLVVRLYEGDIVVYKSDAGKKYGVIKYHNDSGFYVYWWRVGYRKDLEYWHDKIEKLGNIHDHEIMDIVES